MLRLVKDKVYKIVDKGQTFKAVYIGRQKDFHCQVCGKGHNVKTFNVWHSESDYETFAYGDTHMPTIVEQLDDNNYINE